MNVESEKMKVESPAEEREARDENGRDFLKTLMSPEIDSEEIDSVDIDELNNPQYIVPYVHEIMAHLRETEVD